MANNIFQVKRTSVSGRTPNTTSSGNTQYINAGELALNMTDQIVYTSDGTNLITVGSNTVNQRVTGNLTVNAIIANGTLGTSGQVLATNGSGLYWTASGGGGGGNTSVVVVRQQYTGDGAQTTFTVTGGYTANNLDVYLNGVKLYNGTEANVQNGNTFTITPAPSNGSLIEVIGGLAYNTVPYVALSGEQGYKTSLSNNAYYNAGWKYIASSYQAALYSQESSAHKWFVATRSKGCKE